MSHMRTKATGCESANIVLKLTRLSHIYIQQELIYSIVESVNSTNLISTKDYLNKNVIFGLNPVKGAMHTG